MRVPCLRHSLFALLITLAQLTALGQPVVDGAIGLDEYEYSSGDWSMAWDDTRIYVARQNLAAANQVVLYLDADPQSTPLGGSDANGSRITDNAYVARLPFRADITVRVSPGDATIALRNGTGGWTSTSDGVTYAGGGGSLEFSILWSSIPGFSTAGTFNWLAFELPVGLGPTPVNFTPAANSAGPRFHYFHRVQGDHPFATRQSTWQVTDAADSGAHTLRDAIANANADTGSARRFITFDLATASVALSSLLPGLAQATTIDGTTQSGWSGDPIVSLSGPGLPAGISVGGSDCVVRGLVVNGFVVGVLVGSASGTTVAGNWLGLDSSGNFAAANTQGVRIISASGTTVGGTATGDRNVISGNSGAGIWVENSSNTTVVNNYIGTGKSGMTAVPNLFGIRLFSSTATVIGSGDGNVISGNSDDGINGTSADVTILANRIGVAADGSSPLGNGGDGIDLETDVTIGTPAEPNIIANNTRAISATAGGLLIRGNPLDGSAITISGGQPAPAIAAAVVDDGRLRIKFSVAAQGWTAPTQSLQLDLYASVTGARTYRETSPCYTAASLTDVVWETSAGYTAADSVALMVTAYEDSACSDPGEGTSRPSATFTAVPAVSTSTTLVASATTIPVGTNVTLTATVTTSNEADETGTVTFEAGAVAIEGCTAVPLNGRVAVCTTSFASISEQQIVAIYSGDFVRARGESAPLTITVEKAAPTLNLASNTAGVTVYTPRVMVWTATLSGAAGNVAGTVTFLNHGSELPGCANVPLSGGQAQCEVSYDDFSTTWFSVTAVYTGDANHFGDTSDSLADTLTTHVFTGSGNFSTAARWSDAVLPGEGKNFVISGACTFDAAAPARAYGSVLLNPNASIRWSVDHSRALDVTNIFGSGGNFVNMTPGGTLRLRGSWDTGVLLIEGAGTIVLPGPGQFVPPLSFNKLIVGAVDSASGTAYVNDLVVAAGAAANVSGGTLLIRKSILAEDGTATLNVGNVVIPYGSIVTWGVNVSSAGVLAVNGTLTPASPAVVWSGGWLQGSGTVKVLSTAPNSFQTQYQMPSAGSAATIEFAGSATQTIGAGDYYSLIINNPAGATINNAAVTVENQLSLLSGAVSFVNNSGTLTVTNADPSAVIVGSGWIVSAQSNFRRSVGPGSATYVFPVGTAAASAPFTVAFRDIASAQTVGAALYEVSASDLSQVGLDPNRKLPWSWRLDADVLRPTVYDVTFDITNLTADAAATPGEFVVRHQTHSSNVFYAPAVTRSGGTVTALNITAAPIDRFYLGNQTITSYAVTPAAPSQTANRPFNVTVHARDNLGVNVTNHGATTVTFTGTGVQFDGNSDGTYGDTSTVLTNGTATIRARAAVAGPITITAADTNGKGGTSATITVSAATTSTAVTSSANPSTAGQSVTFTATVTSPEAGTITGTVTFRNGGTMLGNAALTGGVASLTTSGLTPGTHAITATYEGDAAYGSSASAALSQVVASAFGAPAGVAATATSTTQVSVSWIPVSGATSYEVFRATVNGNFALRTTTTSAAIVDAASANTTYLYRVRAIGSGISGFSATDTATTVIFTDASLAAGTRIKATHLTELRTAVNAMRAAAGLAAATFTDSSISGVRVKAVHLTELRTALNAARTALAMPAVSYTDPSLTAGVTIKAAHVRELRAGTQ